MSLGVAAQSIAVSINNSAIATATVPLSPTNAGAAPAAAAAVEKEPQPEAAGAGAAAGGSADEAIDVAPVQLAEPTSAEVKAAVVLINSKLSQWHTDRTDEKVIIDCLSALNASQLNGTLLSLDVQKLISKVDDRGMFGPNRRTELLTLLTKRIPDLSIDAKAHFVTALQRTATVTLPIAQTAVVEVLTGVSGSSLVALKRRIDLNYCTTDLHSLLWSSLPVDSRKRVFGHFQSEAKKLGGGASRPVKILSDIDDTFYDSLFDYSYPTGTVYPGLCALYQALDDGGAEDGKADAAGDLVFLTARPAVGGLLRASTFTTLKKHGVPVPFSMLNGTLSTALSNTGMATKKHANFIEYRACYPEYRFVFIGDSGQGDIMLGQKMLAADADAGAGDAKAAAPAAQPQPSGDILVMIHDIRLKTGAAKNDSASRAAYLKSGIVLFDSYVSAALTAFQRRLITRNGLLKVVDSAHADFKRVIAWKDESVKTARFQELTAATNAVAAELAAIDDAKAKAAAAAAAPVASAKQNS